MTPVAEATVWTVIAVNVAVSLWAFRTVQHDSSGRADRFLFVPYRVARGENGIGMLLAHFAHASAAHLVVNMLALY